MRRACAFKSQNKVLYRLYTVFQWNGLSNLTTAFRTFYSRYEHALSKACNAHNRYRRNNDFGIILMYSRIVNTCPYKFHRTKNRESIEFINVFSTRLILLVAGLEPARCCHRGILSPLRLPIPPHLRTLCQKCVL